GMPLEKVRFHQIFTGGAFGGKLSNQQSNEAARIAKLTGKPIQLVWSRDEEFLFDRLRHAAFIRIESGINAEGNMEMWDYNFYFGGGRGARHFYDIPHHNTISHRGPRGTMVHPFFTGPWRGPSNNTNTMARESQIEIMAAATGRDALQFRLDHLKGDQKMARVLEKGAEKFGWIPAEGPGSRKPLDGPLQRGYGIACGIDAGTYIATFAEVDVNIETGHVQVVRTVISQDMGLVVNYQGARIQAEGALIMGLGYALGEEVEFEGRKMLSSNFDNYNIAKFSWTPKIDVVFVDVQDEPPQGGGEPAIIAIGGATANAVFDATGGRIFQLPITKERVLNAIKDVT
ncbi:xanthine dehydrogenase family protein molybdopterin-binding subunit, partial [Bacteroidota bacterium]